MGWDGDVITHVIIHISIHVSSHDDVAIHP
jgi:hypothetical protein